MKFGITPVFECSYLPDMQEQLLVCTEPDEVLASTASQLAQHGFRRSGQQMYRPHCPSCSACHSVRVRTAEFSPSKSQKRVLSKNKDLRLVVSMHTKPSYYPLYERYVNTLHSDGSMFPASPEQFSGFTQCNWQQPLYLEAWLQNELVAVAVTDTLQDGYSALYSFFDPECRHRSLGSFMILQQIQLCQQTPLPYLYLGYQVDDCRKMSYKTKFSPYERFFADKWHLCIKS